MSPGRCPRPEALARAASLGLDEPLRLHLESCGDCSAAWRTQVEMAALGKEMNGEPTGTDRREHVRALLLAAPAGRSRRWHVPALAAAVAAAAVLVFWLRPRPPMAKAPAAVSVAAPEAHAGRMRHRDLPDEQVPPAPPGEEALFQQAAASARGGGPAAREGLQQFLDRYPRSSRAAEASVLLGWLYLASGDRAEAEARFRAGLQAARSRRVRHSAHEGIEAISGESERRRGHPERGHPERRHR